MNGSNLTYEQLITTFMPRPIRSDEDYRVIQTWVDALVDKEALTRDEQDYLTVLGLLVEQYEDEVEPDIELRGVVLIKALLAEQGLRHRDLVPIFKTDSIVSAVLNGKRQLTAEHIDKLAHFFQLPHELFFESATASVPVLT
jgi:HTH-type transcriptional regulator/antitoxin HigA